MPKRRTVLTGFLATSHLPEVPVAATAASDVGDQPNSVQKPIQQTLYLPPAVHDQLRTLAFHRRVKMHAIVLEGLDKVFRETGMKTIYELSSEH